MPIGDALGAVSSAQARSSVLRSLVLPCPGSFSWFAYEYGGCFHVWLLLRCTSSGITLSLSLSLVIKVSDGCSEFEVAVAVVGTIAANRLDWVRRILKHCLLP